jgi:hypothetical protein
MKHGMKKDKERMGMMYGGRKSAAGGMYMMDEKKRKPKNMGGLSNTQPMYSEDMPKAMPN